MGYSPDDMFKTFRRVIAERGSVSGDRASGSHSKGRGSSSAMRPASTFMPMSVEAMLLATDQVRVLVDAFTPGA